MSSYEFQNALFRTERDMLSAIAGIWLEDFWPDQDADWPARAAMDCIEGWGLNAGDVARRSHMSRHDYTAEALEEAFRDIQRQRPGLVIAAARVRGLVHSYFLQRTGSSDALDFLHVAEGEADGDDWAEGYFEELERDTGPEAVADQLGLDEWAFRRAVAAECWDTVEKCVCLAEEHEGEDTDDDDEGAARRMRVDVARQLS